MATQDPPPSEGGKSYGNVGEHHWTRTRGERNAEAIDYYRERSQAPGVAEGGAARNSYCMRCDGVIPWDGFEGGACPHCGAALEGNVRRYFNWVEIDRPPEGDARAVLRLAAAGLGVLALCGALLWWWLS
jgi:hypothetical protein